MDKLLFALFDWDGTVYPGFTLLPWTEHLCSRDLFDIDCLSRIRLLFNLYHQGRIGYGELCAETANIYAVGLAGKSVSEVDREAYRFVGMERQRIHGFARPVFDRLRQLSVNVVVISGAPVQVISEFAKQLQISHVHGLNIERDPSGSFTECILENPGLAKEETEAVQRLPKGARVILACGNSIDDLPLLDAAEAGIVVDSSAATFTSIQRSRLIFSSAKFFVACVC